MRTEGQKKMGYYPTPDSVVCLIRTRLDMSLGKFVALDPCCGKGIALRDLLNRTQGVGYGVELNELFIPEAKSNLYKVARGGYESARITNSGFSLLYLNPPYDTQAGTETEKGMRKEYIFLKDTVKYLKKGGVLVYIIPQERLKGNIPKLLAYRFRNIQVYKFPEAEYKAFGQIVLFGILKEQASTDKQEVERLNALSEEPDLPELSEASIPEYEVPLSEEVPLFRSGLLNNDEVLEGIDRSSLRKKIKSLTQDEETVIDARPVTEPHKGHQAMLLAAGYGNGVMGVGESRHLVLGKVEGIDHEEIEEVEDQNGNIREVKKVTHSHSVRIVYRKGTTGEVVTLM